METIIDVNLNRLSEGFKVVEDILRFHYQDKKLLFRWRKEATKARKFILKERERFLPFRESEKDLGRPSLFDKGVPPADLKEIAYRNLKRCQESSRILEEIYKLRKEKVVAFFKDLRFFFYDFEKELFLKDKKTFSLRVYPIIDIGLLGEKDYRKLTIALVKAGATILQLRAPKNFPTIKFLKIAQNVSRALKKTKTYLIINDRVDISLASNAAGVHLGDEDLPVAYAREILGREKIIGRTVRNLTSLRKAEKEGADYVACGAIFQSQTKPDAKVIGIEGLEKIVQRSRLPVVAIGGINLSNIKEVLKRKVSGVAFFSAIFSAPNYQANCQKLVRVIKNFE